MPLAASKVFVLVSMLSMIVKCVQHAQKQWHSSNSSTNSINSSDSRASSSWDPRSSGNMRQNQVDRVSWREPQVELISVTKMREEFSLLHI